jgi:hypothetical protein
VWPAKQLCSKVLHASFDMYQLDNGKPLRESACACNVSVYCACICSATHSLAIQL